MNFRFKTFLAVAVGVVFWASVSGAAVIIAYQDGTVGHTFDGSWTTPVAVGVGGPGTVNVGGGAGVLVGGNAGAVSISGTPAPGEAWEDLIFTTSADLTGDYATGSDFAWEPILGLSADFYAYEAVGSDPWDFRLYMMAGGDTWYYDVGPLSAGWNAINVDMSHLTMGGGWYNEGALGALDFQADLANVQRIGFDLSYLTDNELQTYGFDNIVLYDNHYVPEPATYLVLAVALASLAFAFREQVRETLGTVLATVRG